MKIKNLFEVDETHPLIMRDKINPICSKCGKPKKKTTLVVSHRGIWKHGVSKLIYKEVGEICQCNKEQK